MGAVTEKQRIVRAAVGVFGGIFIVGLLGFGYLYYLLGISSWALDAQMKATLGNDKAIQRIAADRATARLLEGMPKTSAVDGSDMQGLAMRGDRVNLFYAVVTVGHQNLNAYMKEDTRSIWHRVFPRWTLYKVSTRLTTTFSQADVQS